MKWVPRRLRVLRLRTLLLCLLLLVAGAAVNVAVAWGCALSIRPDLHDTRSVSGFDPETGEVVSAFLGRQFGLVHVSNYISDPFYYADKPPPPCRTGLPRWALAAFASDSKAPHAVHAWGWPASAGLVEWRYSEKPGVAAPAGAWHLPLVGLLPWRPIWPGFAINTVFYAAILCGGWLLFAAPFAVRRRRRIKRGLCPVCAYPIGTSDVCTECGKPVTPRSVEAVT